MKLIILSFLAIIASAELFSVNRDFQVSNMQSPQELAHVVYEKLDRKTGWNRLYVYANSKATPLEQHQAAGFLEGFATYMEIWNAFNNYVMLDFGNPYAPPKVQAMLDQQINWMDEMVKSNPGNKFWTYIGYYLTQARYMYAGYMARVKMEKLSEFEIQFKQFYYLTCVGDLEDMLYIDTQKMEDRKNCDIYIRLENSKLFFAHNTHNRYSLMLRIFKTWNFPREGVPLQSVSFTSRPGDLISKDDYFLLSSGLRVMETSLNNLVKQNFAEIRATTAPSWIRTVVANHLSNSPEEWISYFNTSRSGTHNNQWMIVDSKRVGKTEGLLLMFEEAFSVSSSLDMTSELLEKGYIAGFNMPITFEVYSKLGLKVEEHGTYRTDERALAFVNLHPKMKTEQDIKYYLIMNDNQDYYCHGIATRCDNDIEYPNPFGMTDCKVGSADTVEQNYFWAISGPTTSHGRFPPFEWKNFPTYPHQGLHDVYNFGWQKIYLDIQKAHLTTTDE